MASALWLNDEKRYYVKDADEDEMNGVSTKTGFGLILRRNKKQTAVINIFLKFHHSLLRMPKIKEIG